MPLEPKRELELIEELKDALKNRDSLSFESFREIRFVAIIRNGDKESEITTSKDLHPALNEILITVAKEHFRNRAETIKQMLFYNSELLEQEAKSA